MNDNRDIVMALDAIKSELHDPFKRMNEDSRHEEIIDMQNRQHK